jgi:hypothetical protein
LGTDEVYGLAGFALDGPVPTSFLVSRDVRC